MITKLEIKRQLVHIFLGITIVLLLRFDLINVVFLFILTIFGFALSFLSRIRHIPIIYGLLKKFDREKDLKTFPGKGVVFYVFGAFLAVLLFPKNVAMASIMILALGDSVSRLVGPYGYLKHPFHSEKFLEGVLAGALAAFLGALLFISWIPAAAASIVAMLLEGIDWEIKGFRVDDNLMIPLVAGGVIWLLMLFFVGG